MLPSCCSICHTAGIITLLLLCICFHPFPCQDDDSSHTNITTQKNLIAIQSYRERKCPEKINKEDPNMTNLFMLQSQECLKLNPLVWGKAECSSEGLNYTLCSDSQCRDCITKQIPNGDCISGQRYTCTSVYDVNDFFDYSKESVRISFHKFGPRVSQKKCVGENTLAWMQIRTERCHSFGGVYFAVKIEGNEMLTAFYSDSKCREKMRPFGGRVSCIPFPVDECFQSPVVDDLIGVYVKVQEAVEVD